MSVPPEQAETAALLTRLAGRAPAETHVSAVYVGRDTVWKLKKAVRLSYLDFSTIEARRHFLQRELELNRDAAPGLYRDVVPVRRGADGILSLEGEGAPVDWVLRMARVPEPDFLDAMAARGALMPDLLDALGDCIAACHARLPSLHDIAWPDSIRRVTDGNAVSAVQAGLPGTRVREWRDAMAAALDARHDWLAERARSGFVRRAHGDLHLGNLCLWQGRPVPFDALEFDEELARIDIAYDLAFLLMDLDHRMDRAAANRVMNRYLARNGDLGMLAGLPPYLSLRAMVRAHVQASRGAADWRAYLDSALAYLADAPAPVVAIGGLQGTGKTTLARALAPALGPAPGAAILRSDELRKRLHGAAPEDRLPQSAYGAEANARLDSALAEAVRHAAATGHGVIADATFHDPALRRAIAQAARDSRRDFIGIWLHAPMDVLEARVATRTGDASDATIQVLRQFAATSPGAGDWCKVEAVDRDAALRRVKELVGTGRAAC